MRITENSPARLTLRDRTLFISVICGGAAAFAFAVPFFSLHVRAWSVLIPPAVWVAFGLAFLHTSDVTFDKVARTCDIRRLDVFRRQRTRLGFDEIVNVNVETRSNIGQSQLVGCRLSLETANAVVPLTAAYEPTVQKYDLMRSTILDVVVPGGSPHPKALDSVETLARQGRTIDAVATLRRREGLGLTEARARVDEMLKTANSE